MTILSKIFFFASEQQRLAYEDTIDPYSLFALLKGNEADLASALLRCKGVVLDSVIEDRLIAEDSKNSEDRGLVERLAADKRQLGQLLLETPMQPSSDIDKKIEHLEREVEQMEGELGQRISAIGSARRALSLSVDKVQTVIPDDSALIEYLQYSHYLGKGKWEQRYGAIVLFSKGAPLWIPLGRAKR